MFVEMVCDPTDVVFKDCVDGATLGLGGEFDPNYYRGEVVTSDFIDTTDGCERIRCMVPGGVHETDRKR